MNYCPHCGHPLPGHGMGGDGSYPVWGYGGSGGPGRGVEGAPAPTRIEAMPPAAPDPPPGPRGGPLVGALKRSRKPTRDDLWAMGLNPDSPILKAIIRQFWGPK